jgi:hypothetical protein
MNDRIQPRDFYLPGRDRGAWRRAATAAPPMAVKVCGESQRVAKLRASHVARCPGVQPLPAPVHCPRVGHDAYLEVRDVTQGLMATQETPFASDLIEE